MLACLLLWQQVALASHACTDPASAVPAAAHVHAGSAADHACSSLHASDCDTDTTDCAQHCAQAAVALHDATIYPQPHFPTAIGPPARFLAIEPLLTGSGPIADMPRAPPGRVPARLLYCSLQI